MGRYARSVVWLGGCRVLGRSDGVLFFFQQIWVIEEERFFISWCSLFSFLFAGLGVVICVLVRAGIHRRFQHALSYCYISYHI